MSTVTDTQPPDLTPNFFVRWVLMCSRLGVDPVDLIRVSYSESNVMASAHNPHGDASGICQMMPFVLRNLGWTQGDAAFRKLPAEDQLPFVERYFRQWNAGQWCRSDALCYVATFTPALLRQACEGGPDYVLVGKAGPLPQFYAPNAGLDVDGDGRITVRDLGARLAKVCKGARYDAIVYRLRHAMGEEPPPIPEPPPTDEELAAIEEEDGGISRWVMTRDVCGAPPDRDPEAG